MHLSHVTSHGAAGGDVTGALAAAAGVVLLGLAAAIPWRHRGHGTWRSRPVALVGGFLASLFVLGPVALGIIETHKWREPVGDPPSAAYREVTVRRLRRARARRLVPAVEQRRGRARRARRRQRPQGLGGARLDARPPRLRRAASTTRAAAARARAPRTTTAGTGARTSPARWTSSARRTAWTPTGSRAVGISTGADVLLEVAGEGREDLAALVTDGAAAGSYEDWHRLRGDELGMVPGWTMFAAMHVFSGDAPGPALEDLVPRIDDPTLLISAGTSEEKRVQRALHGRPRRRPARALEPAGRGRTPARSGSTAPPTSSAWSASSMRS